MRRLRIGRPGPALIVAPHPDDETIGAFGLIRALRRRGIAVRVIVVSDGAASHPASPRWPRRRLVAERRRETRRAMSRAGVAAGAIRFLGLPDGALPEAGCAALAAAVARIRRLGLTVGPCRDDAHPDHCAVAAALDRMPARGRRLSYRVWSDRPRRAGRGQALPLGTVAAKRSAIRAYRSQCGAITDDPAGFAFSTRELAGFSHPVERFREERR